MNSSTIDIYLKKIGMGEPFRARVTELILQYAKVARSDIEQVFVSDYVEQNGDHRYGPIVVLFNAARVVEIHNFSGEPTVWIASLPSRIDHVEVRSESFD